MECLTLFSAKLAWTMWVIKILTNIMKTNCKIVNCADDKMLNVHINQLKPVKPRTDIIYQSQRLDEQSTTCGDNVGQYLEEFDDSPVVVNLYGVMRDEQLCVDNLVSGGSVCGVVWCGVGPVV